MNVALALIKKLERQDIHLAIRGERLRIDAPRGVINSDLVEELKDHKAEIIDVLHDQREANVIAWRYVCDKGKAAGTMLTRENNTTAIKGRLETLHRAEVIRLARSGE